MRASRAASGPAGSTDLWPGMLTRKPVGSDAPLIRSIGPSILRRRTLPWLTLGFPNGATLIGCLFSATGVGIGCGGGTLIGWVWAFGGSSGGRPAFAATFDESMGALACAESAAGAGACACCGEDLW